MKRRLSNQRTKGLTLVEVTLVVVVLFVLAGLLLPAITRPSPTHTSRIHCISNLKQVGLALRMFSGDHGERFPWAVSTTEGGSLEFANTTDVFRHYLAVSNELSSPKVLQCRSDLDTTKVSSWPEFENRYLSYFVGLDANESMPQTILTGDRNITGGVIDSNGVTRFAATTQAGWGRDIHKGEGNIGLGDGSAQQVIGNSLRKQIQSALQATNVAVLHFSIPKPK